MTDAMVPKPIHRLRRLRRFAQLKNRKLIAYAQAILSADYTDLRRLETID